MGPIIHKQACHYGTCKYYVPCSLENQMLTYNYEV